MIRVRDMVTGEEITEKMAGERLADGGWLCGRYAVTGLDAGLYYLSTDGRWLACPSTWEIESIGRDRY